MKTYRNDQTGERAFKSANAFIGASSKQLMGIKMEFSHGLDDVFRVKEQGLEKQRHFHYHFVLFAIAHSVSLQKGRNDSFSQICDFLSYCSPNDWDLTVMQRYLSEKFFVDNLAK